MNYRRPELGERLAADYVLGMMPTRARRRFEQAMADDAALAATVAAWSDRLAPLDTLSPEQAPPAHVWRAINQRIGPNARAAARPSRTTLFWRGFAVAAIATCAGVVIEIAAHPISVSNVVTAVAEQAGIKGLMDTAHMPADIGLSTIRLGVPERERPRWLRAALLLTSDALPLTEAPKP